MSIKPKTKSLVYIPPDAGLNFSNNDSNPPVTEYERRRSSFKKEEVKNLTKGKYGRRED